MNSTVDFIRTIRWLAFGGIVIGGILAIFSLMIFVGLCFSLVSDKQIEAIAALIPLLGLGSIAAYILRCSILHLRQPNQASAL
jgi:hypothetical protein